MVLHPMGFSAFAEAIAPGVSVGLTPRMCTSALPMAWLAEVWDSTQRRLTFWVDWNNGELAQRLPLAAQRYRFEDSTIQPIVERLGLDPACQQDGEFIAGILATSQAWVAAIQADCARALEAGLCQPLAVDLADDYLLLTSHWVAHPWVRERLQDYRLAKTHVLAQAKPAERAIPEPSRDLNWPSAVVIHVGSPAVPPEELATLGFVYNQLT